MQEQFHGPNQFDFLPLTLTLPREAGRLEQQMKQNPYQYWIVKPA